MFVTFTGLFLFITIHEANVKFEKESIALQESQVESKKRLLSHEVKRFMTYVENQRTRLHIHTQDVVKQRVLEAHNIAQTLYETHKRSLSAKEIQTKIIETLRLMRYENNQGYYFITRLDGVEILFTDRPEMEGQNMLHLQNAEGRCVVKGMIDIVRINKEGFYEYEWSKPSRTEENFNKIAYVKLFEPYGWFIGTGLYLDDMEQKLKDEILNNKERLLLDKELGNYIFIGTWLGDVLTHPAQGKNMFNVKDMNGKLIVQELIDIAKTGGGFVEYVMPSLKGERNIQKLSYVVGIPEWQWYIGAGIYLEDISHEVEQLREQIRGDLESRIVSIIVLVTFFTVLLIFFYSYVSQKIKKDFAVFIRFFDSLIRNDKMINLEEIKFFEFETLAKHANTMLEEKIKTRIDLERYKKIVSSSDELLSFIDKHYTYLAISEGYVRFFGKPKEEILGKSMAELFGQSQFEKDLKPLSDRALRGESFENELWLKAPCGDYQYLHVKYFPYFENDAEEPEAYIVSAHDLTDKKINEEKLIASEKELEFLAHNDPLTGLPNRLFLHNRISHAIHLCSKNHLMLAVCYMDMDDFKKINDSFGHSYGDEILKQFANRLTPILRSSDTLARIGGDEFIVLIEHLRSVEDVRGIISKIQALFYEPFFVKEQKFFLSISLGISFYPEHGLNSEMLIKNADAAMYKAKDLGKNTYAFYTIDMTIASYERIGLENALREAIKEKQFIVFYQPQIDLNTNEVCGVEALIRWNHPKEGLLSPSMFISLCEETRLILDIGAFVLDQACFDLISLQKEFDFKGSVSVNVSGVQIEYSDFLETLEATLMRTNLAPELLEIEITESFIMNDPERWIALLEKIQALGLKIAIDDFGTGYSSLSYLRKLPIDKLKVDKSFVKDIPYHEDASSIVNSIIDLAQNMKISTLAEGIETIAQENYLKEHGCEQAQGYWYAKPMNMRDLKLWMMNRQKESCKN